MPEKIPERRVIVYKTCIDPAVIKLVVEGMKKELFVRMGFLRPRPEDVQFSIDKYYEPYIFLEGRYSVDYVRKHSFALQVDEDAEEVVILGKKFKPEVVNDPERGSYGVITLEAERPLSHERGVKLILDKAGREVPFERMPFAPSEEEPERILEHSERTESLQIGPDEEIEILRSRIVQRPAEVDGIAAELFEVSERALIYTPVYEVTFQNAKTGEERVVKIDGVDAEILEEGYLPSA